jgi:polysaccharide deacetylase 2 family uncharacterized protein YibQ
MRNGRSRRRPRGLPVLAVAAGLALGLVLGWAWQARRHRPPAARVGAEAPRSHPAPHPSAGVPSRGGRAAGVKLEPAPPAPRRAVDGPRGRVALVIDDLGRRPADLDAIAALGVPVAHAVLPFEKRSREIARQVRARGGELVLHLPMESAQPGEDPGPGALRRGMGDAALRAAVEEALAEVEGATGLNNHMGSALTADPQAMRLVLGVAAQRGLFFLDSRTTPESVAFATARELGVPALERQVFLDDDLAPEAIRAEFARLLALADDRGEAIAIGHPHPATLAILGEEVPRAKAAGIRFVSLRELLPRAVR